MTAGSPDVLTVYALNPDIPEELLLDPQALAERALAPCPQFIGLGTKVVAAMLSGHDPEVEEQKGALGDNRMFAAWTEELLRRTILEANGSGRGVARG